MEVTITTSVNALQKHITDALATKTLLYQVRIATNSMTIEGSTEETRCICQVEEPKIFMVNVKALERFVNFLVVLDDQPLVFKMSLENKNAPFSILHAVI